MSHKVNYNSKSADLEDPEKMDQTLNYENYKVVPTSSWTKNKAEHVKLTSNELDEQGFPAHGRTSLKTKKGEESWCNSKLTAIYRLAFRGYKNMRSRLGSSRAEEEAISYYETESWSLDFWSAVFDQELENRAHARIMHQHCATSDVKVPKKHQFIRNEQFFWPDVNGILGGNLCFILARFIPLLKMASRWYTDATYQLTAPFEKSGFRQTLIVSIKGSGFRSKTD